MASGRGSRLGALVLVAAIAACTARPGAAPEASEDAAPLFAPVEWRTEAPETQGFDSLALADSLESLRAEAPGVHGAVVVRNGAKIVDAAFYPYDGETPHAVGSIAKVVTTALLAIAADRGLVSLDDRVLSFVPDETVAERDARKEGITLRHLATMTSGLDCVAVGGEDTLVAMMGSDDWASFVLDLPMVAEPGATFHYCSPGTHLLAAVLQRVLGVSLLESARQYLFEPLGISATRWSLDPQGVAYGFGGLYLLPEDIAKLGVLWASGGWWDGRRVLPDGWVEASTKAQAGFGSTEVYGIGWWVARGAELGEYWAVGHGGQLLWVDPDRGLVVVVVGSGVAAQAIRDRLLTALASEDRALLSDPLGEKRLAAVTESVQEAPEAVTPGGSKTTIKLVSGVTWLLDDQPLGIATIRLDLKGKDREGVLRMGSVDDPIVQQLPIGLDGMYRIGLDRYRRPVAARGEWVSGRTFRLELDAIADGQAVTLRLKFAKDGETVAIEGQEAGHDGGFAVEGRAAPSD